MVVRTPFARIGDGRVLHEYNCRRVGHGEDRRDAGVQWGLPVYMTRVEAASWAAMFGRRTCRSCDPDIGE